MLSSSSKSLAAMTMFLLEAETNQRVTALENENLFFTMIHSLLALIMMDLIVVADRWEERNPEC